MLVHVRACAARLAQVVANADDKGTKVAFIDALHTREIELECEHYLFVAVAVIGMMWTCYNDYDMGVNQLKLRMMDFAENAWLDL
jgi:hypothetical protein